MVQTKQEFNQNQRKKSIRMATSKDTMLEMDPKEVLGSHVDNLDAILKELNITVGTNRKN